MNLTVRPRRVRRACWVASALVVVVFAVVAVTLRSTAEVHVEVADQVGLFAVGLLAAAGILRLARIRLDADDDGLRIRNVFGERVVPWTAVRAVEFRDGSPWASLDLVDDETVALLAVQAMDGEPTVAAVTALRELLARSRAGT